MFGGYNKRLRAILQNQWGKNPLDGSIYVSEGHMQRVRIYHDEISEERDNNLVDQITWDDLEMDEVYQRLNATKSFVGEQVLYHKLHEVNEEKDWDSFERQQRFIRENEEQRYQMQEKLCAIGKLEEAYHMPKFLIYSKIWEVKNGMLFYALQLLLAALLVLSITTGKLLFQGGLVISILTNLTIYTLTKQHYNSLFSSLGRLVQIYNFAKWMMEDEKRKELFGTEDVQNAIKELKALSKSMTSLTARKQAANAGDISGLLADYLWGVTLLDVAAFNRIISIISDKLDSVMLLYRFAGEVDCSIAVASVRESFEQWCMPQFTEERRIKAVQVAHPLIADAVANDFELDNRAMITGANASGKSTFMKTLTTNIILAQNIHTCIAEELSLPYMYIMTCMSLRDDLLSGDSYYIRETKYLKRMIDNMEKGGCALYVIDEILKGTNTKERIAASNAILGYIANTNCFAIVATHDVELMENEKYSHYYFESTVIDNDIVFNYKINKGIGGNTNAIALLKVLNYPKEILENAEINLKKIV